MIRFRNINLKNLNFNLDQDCMLAIAYYRGKLNDYKNHPIISEIIKKIEDADYIYAPIADNRMYQIIEQFIDEQCKHCLAAINLGKQYVFLTEKAIIRGLLSLIIRTRILPKNKKI